MNLIQIVPRLPPATDGVGDYALNLAHQLRQDFEIKTHFIVGDRTWHKLEKLESFLISQINDQSSQALAFLLSQLSIDKVLLHYVGYGYAQRGCPVWLIDGLKLWHEQQPERKLVTMFHEVYASSNKPWHSSFWLSPVQKKLASRLAKLSDRILTSKQLYADILSTLSQGKHLEIEAIPVFSNIGEPQQIPPLSERQPWLVIFGGQNNRKRAYIESCSKISSICQILGIKKIIDIGTPTGLSLSDIDNIPIQEMGKLSVNQIQEIFLTSFGGFLNYNPDFLAKSTIFAAYCAYGMLPISAWSSHSLIDGIESGRHYLADTSIKNRETRERFQAIADNAYSWYQNHNLSFHIKTFAKYLIDS